MNHQDTDNDEAKVVGQYCLTKTLGKGTFGKVKQAEHTPTGETVAVKVLQKQLICQQADVERISRQIKILKQIKHEYLTQMYEIIEQPQELYLIMEYANGGDLFQQIVDSEKLKQEDAATYFYQILVGVKYLHSIGITHRDLKPENILLDNKKIKIADFGLGNFFEEGELLKTACGSPCYAAPEMVSKLKYNPCKIDIWSSGIILYAMNCGYLPFQDKNMNNLYTKIKKGDFKMPNHLSQSLKNLLKCILNTNPQERYSIDQILAHPWMQQNARKLQLTAESLNTGLVQSVSDQYGYDKDKLLRALEGNKHNAMTTTYYLCAKREEAKKKEVTVSEVKDGEHTEKQQPKVKQIMSAKLQDNHEEIRVVGSEEPSKLVHEQSIVQALNIHETLKDEQLLISQETFVTEDSTLKKSETIKENSKEEVVITELQKEPREILIEEQQTDPPSPVKKEPIKNAKALLDPTKKRKSIPSITQLLSRPSVKEPKTVVIREPKEAKETKEPKQVKTNNRYQIAQKPSNVSISMSNTEGEVQKPQKLQKIPRMKIEGMKKTATKLYERSTSRSTESVRFGAKKPQRKFTWRRVQKKPRLINAGLLYVGSIEDLKRYMLQNEPLKQDLHIQFYEMRENVLYIFRSNLDEGSLHRHLKTLLHRQ